MKEDKHMTSVWILAYIGAAAISWAVVKAVCWIGGEV